MGLRPRGRTFLQGSSDNAEKQPADSAPSTPQLDAFSAWLLESFGGVPYDERSSWNPQLGPEDAPDPDSIETAAPWYQEVQFDQALTDEQLERIEERAQELGVETEWPHEEWDQVYLEDVAPRDADGGWDGWRQREWKRFHPDAGEAATGRAYESVGMLGLNGDTARRAELLSRTTPGMELGGGVELFTGMSRDTLRSLIEERFIDPDDRQNASPTARECLDYMDAHPSVSAIGYAVDGSRPDHRISIDGLVLGLPYTEREEEEFRAFCEGADELFLTHGIVGHGLRAWWD